MNRSEYERHRRAVLADAAAGFDPELPEWVPGEGIASRPCGRWWDAVRAPLAVGSLALEMLGGRSGPVIASQLDGVLIWLVEVAAASGWTHAGAEVWSGGCWLPVPSAAGSGGEVYWLLPLKGDGLTDAAALDEALTDAAAALAAPRPETAR